MKCKCGNARLCKSTCKRDLQELFPGVPPCQLSLLSSYGLGILLMSSSLAFSSPQHMLGQVELLLSPRAQGCDPGTLPGLSGHCLHATAPILLEREKQGFGGDGPTPSHSKKQKSRPQRRLSAVLPVLVQPEQQALGPPSSLSLADTQRAFSLPLVVLKDLHCSQTQTVAVVCRGLPGRGAAHAASEGLRWKASPMSLLSGTWKVPGAPS